MKLTHALASGSLLSFGSAIDPNRVTRNLRHIENESAKSENDVERFLFDAESMSMAATRPDDKFDKFDTSYGVAKSGKGHKGDMGFFFVGHEECVDADFNRYDSIAYIKIDSAGACKDACQDTCVDFEDTAAGKLIGLEYTPAAEWCLCLFEDGDLDEIECPDGAVCSTCPEGKGQVMGTEIGSVVLEGGPLCYRYGPPGLKPSSFTDFNEDGSLCLSSTRRQYESIKFYNIEINIPPEIPGPFEEDLPYHFDSPQGCAAQCFKAGIVNFVGLFYEKGETLIRPSCFQCENISCPECQDPELEPEPGNLELIPIVYHECACLLPDGAADCSGYPDDLFSTCTRSGRGTGPVAFTVNKELYISEISDPPGLNVIDTSCTRNDNFDPTEPTLGAKFPGQHAKSGKHAKGSKKGFVGGGRKGGYYYDDYYYDDFYYF